MPKLTIEQSHRMSAEEARRCLESLSQDLSDKYGLTSCWLSDTEAKVERTGASGHIKIEPQRVVVHLDLSFALSPIKGKIEERIRQELARLFATQAAV
ncbi:MAG: polyhydroxyalkanoic acid system family protein [Myxococcales bacterium]|nr:polyhydroxyalkanoic acid system family protein [Myxococcota bacterium]MDW8280635.1 polyhydroxyalkanoic acid system family protein [Myxococcales bacterium]